MNLVPVITYALVALIGALGPVLVAKLTATEVSWVLAILGSMTSVGAAIRALFAVPPNASPAAKAALAKLAGGVLFGCLLFGCQGLTPAQLADLQTIWQDVDRAIPGVCTVVEDATGNPTADAICAVIDAAGNIVSTQRITFSSTASAAAHVALHPAPALLKTQLRARAAGVVVSVAK